MRLRNNVAWLAIAALMLATVSPAAGASKDMIQLQTQVQALQDQVARMQQSIDMNMGVMKNLVEQSADSVNKMNTAVNDLQQKMQGQASDTNGRMEQISGQIQSLHDTVDELKSRLAKVSKQLDDMQQGGQNLAAGQPGMTAAGRIAQPGSGSRVQSGCFPGASGGRSVQQCAARLQLGEIRFVFAGIQRLRQVLLQHRSGRECTVLSRRH